MNLFKTHRSRRQPRVSHRVTSEWVWVSLKKWDPKPLNSFAEWMVYIVQQTVHKFSGAVQLFNNS